MLAAGCRMKTADGIDGSLAINTSIDGYEVYENGEDTKSIRNCQKTDGLQVINGYICIRPNL